MQDENGKELRFIDKSTTVTLLHIKPKRAFPFFKFCFVYMNIGFGIFGIYYRRINHEGRIHRTIIRGILSYLWSEWMTIRRWF